MAHTDQIADLLTRVRNAAKACHKTVDIPASNQKKEVVRILQEKGLIQKFVALEDNKQGIIKILLKYHGKQNAIQGLRRISKPGLRVYREAGELRRVFNGLGFSIISTSKGMMTDKECRKMNIGGEVLCEVW
jgi:small subunit ribosomal protein S8